MDTETREKRDKRGRFDKGHRGGPGRPARDTEIGYLRALSEECSLDDWREIVRLTIQRAKEGDCRALEWLSQYLIGRPKADALQLSQLNAAELDHEERESMAAIIYGRKST